MQDEVDLGYELQRVHGFRVNDLKSRRATISPVDFINTMFDAFVPNARTIIKDEAELELEIRCETG